MDFSSAPVAVREVGLRDGLQSIARVLPTEQKREWLRAAWKAGLREIEVGSFVPPRLLPQLADTGELVFVKETLEEAKACGGIETWTVPAAQMGASFLVDAQAVVIDPFASRVWLPRQ